MVSRHDAMVERTALQREGNKGLASDTYPVRMVQKKSQSGSGGRGWLPLVAAGFYWSLLVGCSCTMEMSS
jgi:hypothetical protein